MSSTEKMSVRQVFGERLHSLRSARSLGSAQMAAFLGFSAPVYSRYEGGRIPDADTVSAIADKCGVTVDWLLGRESTPPAQQAVHGAAAVREARDPWGADGWTGFSDETLKKLVETCIEMQDYKAASILSAELARRQHSTLSGAAQRKGNQP